MKNLKNLTTNQKFEYLCGFQFKAIELEEVEIIINKLNILLLFLVGQIETITNLKS